MFNQKVLQSSKMAQEGCIGNKPKPKFLGILALCPNIQDNLSHFFANYNLKLFMV